MNKRLVIGAYARCYVGEANGVRIWGRVVTINEKSGTFGVIQENGTELVLYQHPANGTIVSYLPAFSQVTNPEFYCHLMAAGSTNARIARETHGAYFDKVTVRLTQGEEVTFD